MAFGAEPAILGSAGPYLVGPAALKTRFPVRLPRLNGPRVERTLAAAVPGRLPPFRDERGTCAQRVRKTDSTCSNGTRSKYTNFIIFFRSRILVNGDAYRLPGPAEQSSTFPKVLIFH